MMNLRKMKRIIASIVISTLALSMTSCGGDYAQYALLPNEILMDGSLDGGSGPVDPTGEGQYTVEDIQAMNNGNAKFVYSDEGYVTFLQGRFSDLQIADHEQAIDALRGVQELIGLSAGSEFFCVGGSKDFAGYTYYTYQQRYGNTTVQYATLRVVIDPQGYTAGLASSFVPNLGIAPAENGITAQEAVAIVQNTFAQVALDYYPEATHQVVLYIGDKAYNTWVVYTNNPNYDAQAFDIFYYEHFVSMEGEFLYCLPVASFETTSQDNYQTEKYFEGLQYENRSFTVTTYNGATQTINVPVAYNPKTGLYYLMDGQRKIAVSDFYENIYGNINTFISSSDGMSFENSHLLAYDRYIKTYDFFAAQGIYSVDGYGTPIKLCVSYCDENRNPVNNACNMGIINGWATFGCSDINTYSEAIDVTAHEFTHGITRSSMSGTLYQNETGAINEAYSDILGNLCEMINGYTTDTQWLLGENSGQPMRSMSSPGDFQQPVSTSDPYYVPPTDNPDFMLNDYGGVHTNNSLVNQMAYLLHTSGMTLEQQKALWLTSIELMTPQAGYEELLAVLHMSIDINGLDPAYKDILTNAFQQAGMVQQGVKHMTKKKKITIIVLIVIAILFVVLVAGGIIFAIAARELTRGYVYNEPAKETQLAYPDTMNLYSSEKVPYSFLYPDGFATEWLAQDASVCVYNGPTQTQDYVLVKRTNKKNMSPEKYFRKMDRYMLKQFDAVQSTEIQEVPVNDKTLYLVRYQVQDVGSSTYVIDRYVELYRNYYMEYTAISSEAGNLNTIVYYAVDTLSNTKGAYKGAFTRETEECKLSDVGIKIQVPKMLETKELTIGTFSSNEYAMLLCIVCTQDDYGNPILDRQAFLDMAAADPAFIAGYLGVDNVTFNDGQARQIGGKEFYVYPMTMVSGNKSFSGELALGNATNGGVHVLCYGVSDTAPEREALIELCQAAIYGVVFRY